MKTIAYLLMIKPIENSKEYEIISDTEEYITIPSFPIEEGYPDIEVILEALAKRYIGYNNDIVVNDFVISKASLNNSEIGLYYYTFIPHNSVRQYGYFKNISLLSQIKEYSRIISKLTI